MSYFPYIAAHRFGLGSNPQEMKIISSNPKAWLTNQLSVSEVPQIKGHFENSEELTKKLSKTRTSSKENRKSLKKQGRDLYTKEMEARFYHAINSQTPLLERLVLFWSNHFTVSVIGKPYMPWLVGAYEREAIRPHILGNFSDMLLAVIQHPAMLIYLDNVRSFGPNSMIGKKRGKGLNENLAREVLELHTLGVNGGYTQDDVIGLAKIITGWTIVPPQRGGGGYKFIPSIHEPGSHKLLGKTYNQRNEAQGIEALRDLANHPSTARFVATKMARHFISDNPSQSSISKLEQSFLNTGGDLKAMVETLININEVWEKPLPKIKNPYEMIVSTFRLTQLPADKIPLRRIIQSLSLLEHVPFQAKSPAGWSDTVDGWLSPNSTINRVEWCHAFSQAIRPSENPLTLAQNVLQGVANPNTLLWIERAPTAVEGLALLLASSEWQRR